MADPDDLPTVLFVDDNPGDIELVAEAFRQYGVPVRFLSCATGQEALRLLGDAVAQGQPLPAMVLLDVNLPVLSGHEVLARIRADPALAALPVVMISSSDRRIDIERSEALAATSYVIKPMHWDEYVVLVRAFEQRLRQQQQPQQAALSPLTPPPLLPGLQDEDEP